MVLISQILFTVGILIGYWMGREQRNLKPNELSIRHKVKPGVIRTPQVELYFNERK